MGNYQAAIEARTRAIRLSEGRNNVLLAWEGYHYRWRLYYWQSRFDEALSDLNKLVTFEAGNVCYAHVCPALVQAEMGDMERALATVRRMADEAPRDPARLIWASSSLRILGRPEEADALLARHEPLLDFAAGHEDSEPSDWLRRLYACCRGGETTDELAASIKGLPDARNREAELCFHAAALDLAAGRRAAAIANLERAHESFDSESRYTYHAKTLLMKLQDESWPPWQATTADPSADEGSDRP
jgi:tetratricopeptide (TPR) repeat protein